MTTKDNMAQLATLIEQEALLDMEIKLKQRQLDRSRRIIGECTELIDSTTDPIMHSVLVLHCVRGLSWEQVTAEMPGNCSIDCYKKMYSRWLKEVSKNA